MNDMLFLLVRNDPESARLSKRLMWTDVFWASGNQGHAE